MTTRIILLPGGESREAERGESLLGVILRQSVPLESICGGRGSCGKCRIIVKRGGEHLTHAADAEKKLFSPEEIVEGHRLACRSTLVSNEGTVEVEVPNQALRTHARLLTSGVDRPANLKPFVRKISVKMEEPTLLDVRADDLRLAEALKEQADTAIKGILHTVLTKLSGVLREASWKVTTVVGEDDVVSGVESEDTRNLLYGLAVDVGSTKLAAYLVDLNSGRTVAVSSRENPQRSYGEDIVSRLAYIMERKNGLKTLNKLVVNAVNDMLLEACEKAGVKPSAVYDVVIVGNTAMHHIFLEIQPRFLGLSPYIATTNLAVRMEARRLGLKVNRGGSLYALPCVAGFVGADAVADILTAQMHQRDESSILIDIGTNTEVILGDGERLIAASCPAGPALEGYGIRNGMRASPGAIERVWIDPGTGEVRCETVDDLPPKGICGSGIIDAMAWMLRSGVIDKGGRLNSNHKRVRKGSDGLEFILHPREKKGSEVVVTQRDIREVQLAKGITYTTASLLMKRAGVKEVDIRRIYLAGAFGTYVDYQSAKIIGFLPDLSSSRVQYLGNSAGSGARAALLSLDIRKEASELPKKIVHVELSKEPDFRKEFADSLYFPHRDENRFPTYVRLTKSG